MDNSAALGNARRSDHVPVQGDVPVLQGVFAHNAMQALQPVAVQAEAMAVKQPVKQERPPEPVSKWTLADYDQDTANVKT